MTQRRFNSNSKSLSTRDSSLSSIILLALKSIRKSHLAHAISSSQWKKPGDPDHLKSNFLCIQSKNSSEISASHKFYLSSIWRRRDWSRKSSFANDRKSAILLCLPFPLYFLKLNRQKILQFFYLWLEGQFSYVVFLFLGKQLVTDTRFSYDRCTGIGLNGISDYFWFLSKSTGEWNTSPLIIVYQMTNVNLLWIKSNSI